MQGFDTNMTWNLFGRKPEYNVWCAVPAELALPAFLLTGAWSFGGQRQQPQGPLLGFDCRVADHGAALNGFYVFHMFQDAGEASRQASDEAQP